jgi:tetratricopeptide (TPR) repeat protein
VYILINRKSLFTFVFLVLLVPLGATADNLSDLENSCFSKDYLYAVPACERIIEITEADHKVHFRLAKMYQKQRQYEKAKTTLERALVLFDEQGDAKRVAQAKHFKSNVDEAIWISGQSKEETVTTEQRIKCIRFAMILPEQALSACNQYLSAHPNDPEVLKSKALANSAIAAKAESEMPAEQALVATSRTLNSSAKSATDRVAEIAESRPSPKPAEALNNASSQNKIETNKEEPTLSSAQASVSASQTALEQSAIDPQVIEQIKQELNGLYAMIRQQQQTDTAQAAQSLKYSEQGKRYALVVGNAAYPPAIGRLKNSVNDAVDIGAALKKLDFEVQVVTDGSLQELERAVSDIAKKVQEQDTVLFYYAGHGVALEGENYLLPVNAGISDAIDVKYKSLNLSYVLDKLDRGSSGVTMVVLDACRNNPFPVSRGAMRAGLVQSSGPVGTIIAYSTAPGDVALDGDGRNGLYTKHLLQQMTQPNIKLEDVFKRVRVAVSDETHGSQVPWENSSLKGDFYFSYN